MNEVELSRLEREVLAAFQKAMGLPPGAGRDDAFEEARQLVLQMRGLLSGDPPRVIPFIRPTRGD